MLENLSKFIKAYRDKLASPVALRAIGIGLVATIFDLGFLWAFQNLLPTLVCNVSGLVLGAATHFIGSRYYVFEEGKEGRVVGQAIGFSVIEGISFGLNVLFFQVAVFYKIQFILARILCSFIIFWGFTFPLRMLVFKRHGLVTR